MMRFGNRTLRNEELDALVAKVVMGWEQVDRVAMGLGDGPTVYDTGDSVSPTRKGFAPASEWGCAGIVIDHTIRTLGANWRLEPGHSAQHPRFRVVCKVSETVHTTRAQAGEHIGEADELPRAICLAALAAAWHYTTGNGSIVSHRAAKVPPSRPQPE